jgi:hypothetical protein
MRYTKFQIGTPSCSTLSLRKKPHVSNYVPNSRCMRQSYLSVSFNSNILLLNYMSSTVKRRWERIISRGFEASTSDGTCSQGQGSGAMLEGIREGVQGVSRFLAAGLAIGELSPPLSPAPPRPGLRRTHSANQSSSSISTNTTKSTRFSQSSVSSIGEEPLILNGPSPSKEHDTVQVLIVRDTGATPTMSPNPDFVHKQQQQEQQQRAAALVESSPETEPDCFPSSSMRKSTKIHRRKSRDNSNSVNLTLPLDNILTLPDLKREVTRATMHGSPMPPIPGLGSLTLGTTSPPVVSWVGSVGKKWEELQRGSTYVFIPLFLLLPTDLCPWI